MKTHRQIQKKERPFAFICVCGYDTIQMFDWLQHLDKNEK